MDTMKILMNKMARSKGESGYVVFVKHQSVPGGQPMRGRPQGTRAEAEEAARQMLANPVFVQAWTVGCDGIVEVTR